jgi:hypothetical protein
MTLLHWIPSFDVLEVTTIALEGSQQVVAVSSFFKPDRIVLL